MCVCVCGGGGGGASILDMAEIILRNALKVLV